jgi:pimeloyl-ACP methyl ester carboxylesterase
MHGPAARSIVRRGYGHDRADYSMTVSRPSPTAVLLHPGFLLWIALLVLASLLLSAREAASEVLLKRVDGTDMAVEVLGQAGPVVVFESGLGQDMRSWDEVARPLSRGMRVVLYDRWGVGRSAARDRSVPVLASTVADQLAQLLRAINAPAPYILVGHSLGGLYVQSFARRYPHDVGAVVLIDAASPLEPPGVFVSTVPPKAGSIEAAEEAGVAPSVAEMLAGPAFPPVPLIVLAATNHGDTPEREALWHEVQARTAMLSPKGRLEVVEGAGHFIQKERPGAVISAVLEAARTVGANVSGCPAGSSTQR